jgi:hypothetical protein
VVSHSTVLVHHRSDLSSVPLPLSQGQCSLHTSCLNMTRGVILCHRDSRVPMQVVQEYERAVIFRLGRLVSGGAKGPGKKIDKY